MKSPISIENLQDVIIEIRGNKALLDSDVAKIYGVETKRVNEAVKNNLDKFPQDYLFELDQDEKNELVENFDRFRRLKHSTTNPKAFTEKGLYMLATILKSKKATQATFTIIEAFAKIRELSSAIRTLSVTQDEVQQKPLMQRSGEIVAELFDDELLSSPRAGRGWRRTNHGFLRWARIIPASWDWQKKAKILQACLQSFCFTLPHSRSECTCARFFVSVFIRVISGFILFFPVIRCELVVRSVCYTDHLRRGTAWGSLQNAA